MKLCLAALALSYAIFFTCLVATAAELPARIASHFDAIGTANGWMSQGTYIDVMTAIALLAPGFLIACAILVRCLAGRLALTSAYPTMPLTDRETITRTALCYVIVYGALLVLFLTGMHILVVVANASTGAPRLSSSGLWVVVGAFLTATLVWSVLLCRRCVQLTQPLSPTGPG
jgi:hypothetical protein